MLRIRNKGQSTMEYTVLLIVAIGALLAISNYFKRGVQGRWKTVVDDMGDQYDPRSATGSLRHTTESNTETTIQTLNSATGFFTHRVDQTQTVDRKTGFITVGDVLP